MLVLGWLAFGIQQPGLLPAAGAVMALGTACFMAMGFALAGFAQTSEGYAAISNAFFFPMMFLSGVYFTLDAAPRLDAAGGGGAAPVALPQGPAGGVQRRRRPGGHWAGLAVVAAWTARLLPGGREALQAGPDRITCQPCYGRHPHAQSPSSAPPAWPRRPVAGCLLLGRFRRCPAGSAGPEPRPSPRRLARPCPAWATPSRPAPSPRPRTPPPGGIPPGPGAGRGLLRRPGPGLGAEAVPGAASATSPPGKRPWPGPRPCATTG